VAGRRHARFLRHLDGVATLRGCDRLLTRIGVGLVRNQDPC
jgi:hypothetical protein